MEDARGTGIERDIGRRLTVRRNREIRRANGAKGHRKRGARSRRRQCLRGGLDNRRAGRDRPRPAAHDAEVAAVREAARLIAENELLTPALVPLGDGLLAAVRD